MIRPSFISKYRPYNFSDIIGQDRPLRPIINSIKNQDLPNRLFLFGETGVGKTSTAICISRAVNCINYDRKNMRLCGKCYACKANPTATYSFEVIKCGQNPLDKNMITHLEMLINNGNINGKYRVIFFDEFHKWNRERSQDQLNSIIDFLPSQVLLICATYKPDDVSDVLRHRFLQVQMNTLSNADIVKLLKKITNTENQEISVKKLNQIAISSNENPRLAVQLLEKELISTRLN